MLQALLYVGGEDTFFSCVTMFCSSLSPVLYRQAHVLFTLSVIAYAWWCPTHFFVVLRSSVRLYLQFFIGKLMSYLRYLSLLTHGGVKNISLLCYDILFVYLQYEVSCLSFVICLCLRMLVSNTFLSCLPMVGGSIRDSGFFHH
jgi:hypothetical protein